ncbi:MAG: DNA-methyltransferase [Candidatus Odinarchaeia archaeon]
MVYNQRRKGTKTSSFGSPGRINHDATQFYSSKLYQELQNEKNIEYTENSIPENTLDKILLKSSENMDELPDCSIHLMVTSPPYNVGKEYDENLTLDEYLDFLKNVWREVYRVIVPGGRACINIANLGRKPYIPLHAYIIKDMIDIGFLMRGEIIWDKSASAGASTAWGSWLSATNPTLRDTHEYILVFSKGRFSRKKPENRESTITREEFLEYTKSVWYFPTESAKKIGHPAPFPVELPLRLIKLYTFTNENILDPFIGSGTTALAAMISGRHYIGYEIEEKYIKIAEKRIKKARAQLSQMKLI